MVKGQPWHFDKAALLLTDMIEAHQPSDLEFFALPIWVRIYNVPFRGWCDESNARMLGEKIRDFLEVDKSDILGMEKSLRLRVNLDVRKALKKQGSIKVRGGEICICPVKYEKLPLICFYCGKLRHGTNDCKEVFGDSSPVKQFGPWFKASPWKPTGQEELDGNVTEAKSCGKKLFFTKKPPFKASQGDSHQTILSSVTTLLDKVVLGTNNETDIEEPRSGTRLEKKSHLRVKVKG